jgi:hypothetical protein
VAGYPFIQEHTPDRIKGGVFGALTSAFTVAFLIVGPLMNAVGFKTDQAGGKSQARWVTTRYPEVRPTFEWEATSFS